MRWIDHFSEGEEESGREGERKGRDGRRERERERDYTSETNSGPTPSKNGLDPGSLNASFTRRAEGVLNIGSPYGLWRGGRREEKRREEERREKRRREERRREEKRGEEKRRERGEKR